GGSGNVISANVDFGTQEGVVTVVGDLQISGAVAGTNANTLNKSGTGDLRLGGSNTYTGATNVMESTVTAANANAFGTTAAGTTVQQRAAVVLAGVVIGAEPLTLNSFLDYTPNGGLQNLSGNNTWAGNVTLGNSFPGVSAAAGTTLTLSGVVSGTG